MVDGLLDINWKAGSMAVIYVQQALTKVELRGWTYYPRFGLQVAILLMIYPVTILDGAAGNDTLYGGTGSDSQWPGWWPASGNAGIDLLSGGMSNDTLFTSMSTKLLWGCTFFRYRSLAIHCGGNLTLTALISAATGCFILDSSIVILAIALSRCLAATVADGRRWFRSDGYRPVTFVWRDEASTIYGGAIDTLDGMVTRYHTDGGSGNRVRQAARLSLNGGSGDDSQMAIR